MKKTNLFKFILCCSLLGGVGVFSSMLMPKVEAEVRAEDSETKDMSKTAMEAAKKTYGRWEAKNGDFVSVSNWLASGKGVGFDFKFTGDKSPCSAIVQFRENGVNISSNKVNPSTSAPYLFEYKSGKAVSGAFGEVTELTDGWYRVEFMFGELGLYVPSGSEFKTVNEMWLGMWGENNMPDLLVKNMGIIDPVAKGPQTVNTIYGARTSSSHAANTENRFPTINNWHNSGVGMYLEIPKDFNAFQGGPIGISTESTPSINKASLSAVSKWIGDKKANVGKIIPIDSNWERYEVMFADAPCTDSDAAKGATLIGWASNWGKDYIPTIKGYGIIPCYSYKVTFTVSGTSTSEYFNAKVTEPSAPSAPAGKHFAGWYSDSSFNNKYDFSSALKADLELFAKFDDHAFVNPTYDWAEDGSKVTATATCACGEKFVKETVPSYTKDTDATCLENEKGHMTAVFTDSPFETQTTAKDSVIVPMSKLDHDLDHVDAKNPSCLEAGNKEYWQCKSCSHIFKDSAATEETTLEERTIGAKGHTLVLVNGQAPDCTTDGWKDYYECSDDHALFEDAEGTKAISDLEAWKVGDGKLGKTGHTLNKVDGKVPSCTEDGWKDYYQCSKCQELFEDADGTKAIADLEAWKVGDGKLGKVAHDLELVNGKPATCTEDGWKSYYQCKDCKVYFEDAQGAKAIADLEAWKVGDGKIAAHGHDENNLAKVDGKEPGCEEPGYKDAYLCMECGKYFEDAEAKKLIGAKESDLDAWRLAAGKLDPKGHTYKFVDEVAATKDKDGVKAHYVCEYCGKLFVKEGEVYKEVTLNDLTLKYQAKGCGGSIIATSAIVSLIAIAGIALVASKKKED